MAPQSILETVKTNLDIELDDVDFDDQIITSINTAFATLWQLGIGPSGGYEIEDASATWDAFYGTNKRYNSIRQYVTYCCRLDYDPPQTAHHATALAAQKTQLEWRLSVIREDNAWVDPNPVPIRSYVLDGGDA